MRVSYDINDKEFQNPKEIIKKDKIKSIEIFGGKQSKTLNNDLRISVNYEH